MSLNRICPSLAIGFYLRNMDEFYRFKAQIEEMKKMENCIFSVFDQYADSAQAKMERLLKETRKLDPLDIEYDLSRSDDIPSKKAKSGEIKS